VFAFVCELLGVSDRQLIDCLLEGSDWTEEELQELTREELLGLLRQLEENS